MGNVSEKVHRRILLLCSWQSWILLCSILAPTADILDLIPETYQIRTRTTSPGNRRLGVVQFKSTDEARMETRIMVSLAELRMM